MVFFVRARELHEFAVIEKPWFAENSWRVEWCCGSAVRATSVVPLS